MEVSAKNFGVLLGEGYAYEITTPCSNPNDIMFQAFMPYKSELSDDLLVVWDKRNVDILIASKHEFDGQGIRSRIKLNFPHHLFRLF